MLIKTTLVPARCSHIRHSGGMHTKMSKTMSYARSCRPNDAALHLSDQGNFLESLFRPNLWNFKKIQSHFQGTLSSSELTPLSNSIRDHRALNNDDILPFSSQYLLILVPLSMLILVVLLIVWCRKCSNNNSSLWLASFQTGISFCPNFSYFELMINKQLFYFKLHITSNSKLFKTNRYRYKWLTKMGYSWLGLKYGWRRKRFDYTELLFL